MRLILSVFAFILLNVLSEGQNSPSAASSNFLPEGGAFPEPVQNRTIFYDLPNSVILKDGVPFQVLSGEFEYWRALPGKWRPIMRLMRAAGLNTLSFYVDWALHNPQDGEYDFTGMLDIVKFIQIAAEEDLLVLFRVGPYISAEINYGGFPYWLLAKYPNIKLRTKDPDYMREVEIWYEVLWPRIIPYLYQNGGPIIFVQVENQYGQFGCDPDYLIWARDLTEKFIGQNVRKFTNNLAAYSQIACTKLDRLMTTLDFMPGTNATMDSYWQTFRKFHPQGPLLVSEFYTEWTPIWRQKRTNFISSKAITDSLSVMLRYGASMNFYIFYGGTSFGLTSGTSSIYGPFTTSYGNGGPIDVTGAVGEKYYAIRSAIKEFFPVPDILIPPNPPKIYLPPITVRPITTLFSSWSRLLLTNQTVQSEKPLTFEQLRQDVGFVLYETVIPKMDDTSSTSDTVQPIDSILDTVLPSSNVILSTLSIPKFFDRAYVYADNKFLALLTQLTDKSAQINVRSGQTLQILLESNGRITANIYNRTYGIIGDALLNNVVLNNWNITSYPFDKLYNDPRLNSLLQVLPVVQQEPDVINRMQNRTTAIFTSEPIIFQGTFYVYGEIADTFVNPTGWGKGFIYINGFNLGRYFPLAGPQITLYIPKDVLVIGRNSIVIVEMGVAPFNNVIQFSPTSIFRINGTEVVYDY